MWSSWPWVMTIASIASTFSRRYVKSGSTRSMPSMSAVGKRRPVSTTTRRPSYSTTVMFLPISPRPPSGRTRRAPPFTSRSRSHRAQEAVALERNADLGQLLVGGQHERQPHPADPVAEQVERGLDRDRVDGHGVERPHDVL